MRNVFVTGAGRSGTSMLAGCFARTGAFLGQSVYSGTVSNPKGYFEDAEVNEVNERMILRDVARRSGVQFEELLAAGSTGHLWLGLLPLDAQPFAVAEERRTLVRLTSDQPFCLKDPRFSMTLQAWLPYAPEAAVICIFRDPATTVRSILQELGTAPYLRSLRLSVDDVIASWCKAYLRLLKLYLSSNQVFFVRYEDVLDGSAIPEIERAADCELDHGFPTPTLARSAPDIAVGGAAEEVLAALQTLSANGLGAREREAGRALVQRLLARDWEALLAPSSGDPSIWGTQRLGDVVQGVALRKAADLQRLEEEVAGQRLDLARLTQERDDALRNVLTVAEKVADTPHHLAALMAEQEARQAAEQALAQANAGLADRERSLEWHVARVKSLDEALAWHVARIRTLEEERDQAGRPRAILGRAVRAAARRFKVH